MKYFENLFMRAKLLFSFGLICLIFLAVIVVAYLGFREITRSEKELHDVHFVKALELLQLRSHQNFNRAAILDMMLIKDKTEQTSIEKIINNKGLEISAIIDKLSKFNTDTQFQSNLTKLKREIEEYQKTRREEILFIKEGKIEKAQNLGATIQKERFENIRSLAMEMGDASAKEAVNRLSMDIQKANTSILIFVLLGILALIFSFVMIILLNKTIAQPLNKVTKIASKIAEGDMNIELSVVERTDEVGILLQTFNKMVEVLKNMAKSAQQISLGDLTETIVPQSEKDLMGNAFAQMLNNLRRIMKDITESVNLLASSSSEILAATTQVASGAAETASSISETTTTVEEVRQATQLSNQKASRVSESAQQVTVITQTGQKAVDETVNGMHHIQNQMESIASTIVRLSEQSQQIGGIIASVNDVADQSNLLAVNAAIEAAKAGEQGKGFAVVAQEIKNLALQSKQATIQVRNILSDVQKTTSAAVMATEQGSKAVENGVKQSTSAGNSIKQLSQSVNESVQAASQIVASSKQQSVGMDQIGIAMQNINQASTQNAASMQQAEKAAKDLYDLGKKLKEIVEQYKL